MPRWIHPPLERPRIYYHLSGSICEKTTNCRTLAKNTITIDLAAADGDDELQRGGIRTNTAFRGKGLHGSRTSDKWQHSKENPVAQIPVPDGRSTPRGRRSGRLVTRAERLDSRQRTHAEKPERFLSSFMHLLKIVPTTRRVKCAGTPTAFKTLAQMLAQLDRKKH
jgi:hypothetical protein